MRTLLINRVLKLQIEQKPFNLCNFCKRLSFLNDGSSGADAHKENEGATSEGKWRVPRSNGEDAQHLRRYEVLRRGIENVCQILESGPWGPLLENALSSCDDKPEADLVIGVLRRMKDVNLAIAYFRWVEKAMNQLNPPETYYSLLMLMARCRNFARIEHILEEMSLAGFGPSFETSMELVSSCVRAQRLREAFDLIQTMRKFKFRPAFSAYTTLIGALAAVHKPEYPNLMLSLFYQMQELGYEVSVHLFTTLIRVFARDGQVDAALSLLDEMKSNSFEADIVLYNVCIDCFGKAGKVDIAWKFFHEIKSHGLLPDDVSYTSMIGVLCKAGRMMEAVELFEQMELNRSVPCAYAYNTMIMGYGSAGMFDEVYNLMERQRLKGSIPSVIAYNSLLTCLGRRGKVDEALKVYNDMKTDAMPNLSTYNILVDMLCRAGKVDAALEIQNDMKSSGLTPDIMTVNIMIDRLCKANKLDAACSVFHGMDRKVSTPNKFTFCSLIDGLGRHGRVDDAYRLYEEMLDSNEVPDAIVYTSLIKNFFKSGRKEDGHKIYKEMVQKGISPDLTLLNTYMDCAFKAGETEKGRALFEEIKLRFNPDARSYSILIHGLTKAGFARETYELFYAMKEQGCVLDTLAYNTVIDGFCKSGKVNKAYQLLEEMKAKGHQPTVVTYGSVIDGLAKIDRLDEAYMLFEEAKSIGVELNVVVYSSLVDGFGKVGRIDEAYLIIEEMMQNNLTPNIQTWNCLLDALVKAEEIDEALVCWNSMKDLKCTPNIISYSIIINGLCKVRKFNKAFVFWQEMQKQGLKPNAFTYLTMISGLSKAGNIFEADKLFERFKANGGIPDSACYNTMIEGFSEAPVSVHRSSTGSSQVDAPDPRAFPFPVGDNDISSSTVEKSGLQRPSHDYNVPSNHRQHTKLIGAENWLGGGNSSSKHHAEALNKHGGFERNVGYQLPEEENLISAGDPQDPRVFPLRPGGNLINNGNSSSTPINITEKLAAFGAVSKDKHSMDGSENIPFPLDSFEQRGPDISYSNLQLQQQSSPHFQPPQISQARPLYHHLESHPAHMSSHLKFLPEPTFNHGSPTNHQFSSPMIRPSFHNPNVRVSGFDVPSQHSVLHHMQVPGNHPPHFARGGPGPHHGNQATGFVQEMNHMQGLPFGPRLPNIGGGGMPMSGNPPEAFQRLIEMELRANSKQIRPLAPPGHNQGIYSHELDMESRYR